ncbi:MAG: hypothetical protein LBR52_06680 [Prevotellaceae bacterium]|jgi:hypothetical protein|nr:hypothetical protein [Prevotellaceae bacterium]
MSRKRYIGGFFSILLLIALSGCTAKKKSDLQEMSVQGKVKQITEWQYLAVEKFGKVVKGDLYRQEGWDLIMDFDEQGYFSKITHIDISGNEVGHTDYLYNEQKQLVEILTYDAEGGFSDKVMRTYDEKGRIYEVAMINSSGGISGSVLIDYDENAHTVTEDTYNSQGKLLRKEVRQLNKNKFPVETKIYDGEKNVINHRKETFEKSGLRNALTVFSPEESILMNISFKYDKKGNLIQQEGTDENGETFLPVRYEYEFDEHGNWTQRVEFIGEKPTFVLERQFEYYE